MKKIKEPSSYFLWEGKLAQVISIAEGKTIHFKVLEENGSREHYRLEHSPLFQNNAEPINTLEV